MKAEQMILPFDSRESAIQSLPILDDSVIPEGSLAVAGFTWGKFSGEVFQDGYVAFHDGTEIEVPIGKGPKGEIATMSDEDVMEIIKVAHSIKVDMIEES